MVTWKKKYLGPTLNTQRQKGNADTWILKQCVVSGIHTLSIKRESSHNAPVSDAPYASYILFQMHA